MDKKNGKMAGIKKTLFEFFNNKILVQKNDIAKINKSLFLARIITEKKLWLIVGSWTFIQNWRFFNNSFGIKSWSRFLIPCLWLIRIWLFIRFKTLNCEIWSWVKILKLLNCWFVEIQRWIIVVLNAFWRKKLFQRCFINCALTKW